MKKSYIRLAFSVLLFFVFIFLPALLHAQGPGDPGGGIDPGCPPDVICPIDSWLIVLIAVAVGYGIKKMIDQRKRESIS